MYNYEECSVCQQKMRNFKIRRVQAQKRQFILMMAMLLIVFGYLIWQVNRNIVEEVIDIQEDKELYTYNTLELPTETTGEFKTYMDYRKITDKTSKQWNLQQLATTNEKGFRVFNGRYLVAVGTYYATEVGKELKITLDNGFVFYAMVGDIKMDIHTDANNQYIPINGNIVEFIVDTNKLDPMTKKLGDVSNLGFEGKIVKIEEVISFE